MGGGREFAERRSASRLRSIPTKYVILALIAVLVIPGILFESFLLLRYAQAERARYELQSTSVARSVASVLDAEIAGLQRAVQALSVSKYIADEDFRAFQQQAEAVKEMIGADIGLRSLDGQQLANTRVPWGTPLPSTPFSVDKRAIESARPVITDVFTGYVAKRPLVGIVVPVNVGGEVKYLLHISSETDRFYRAVKEVTPPGWLLGVADRAGIYVTRSEGHADFVGKPGVAAYIANVTKDYGTFVGENAYGDKVLVGYAHTRSGWLVAANIAQSVIEAPLYNALYMLAGFGSAALVLALLVGLWLWRIIARPLGQLAEESQGVAHAAILPPLRTRLQEFIGVHRALVAASDEVRASRGLLEAKVVERTKELELANAELTAQMSARERAEGQLRQIQKMEAVGQLTGGIAHDFNNMLAIVISSLGLVKRRLERGQSDVGSLIDSALDGARRAATLTSRLLAFSRQQPLAPEVVDANKLISGMSELLQRALGQTVKIEVVLAAGLWRTKADSAQLENAILNLCVNGRDAMSDGGRLTIETANAFLDEAYAGSEDDLQSGQYVQIAVSDTGTGMEPEVMARAFDPFFTTKRLGMGTGLGLSQVYGFVKQSNGHVKIYSEIGSGTTIKIYLPRFYGTEEALPAARDTTRGVTSGSPQEVVLVVEDETNLRHLTITTLRELGYTVLEASSAREALTMLGEYERIDLLFTDIVMPDINGRVLADEARKRRPDLRVLYTTGFTRNAVVHNGILDAGVNFIAKPFSMESLGAKVREVLDSP